MAKIITTDKKTTNGESLTFSADFKTVNNQTQYTQANTYIWDSCNDDVNTANIDDINKLIHAVSIDWDNPSGCESLTMLNDNKPIKTTDDIIYILDKLAQIAINGNDNIDQMTNVLLDIAYSIDTDTNGVGYYTFVGTVNHSTENDGITWNLLNNNGSYFYIKYSNEKVQTLTGNNIQVCLDMSKLNTGEIEIRDTLEPTTTNNKYNIYPYWNAFGSTIRWDSPRNNVNVISQIKATYQNAEDQYETIQISDLLSSISLSSRLLNLSFINTDNLSTAEKQIFASVDSISPSNSNNIIDNDYFSITRKLLNGQPGFFEVQIKKSIPEKFKNVKIKINAQAGMTGKINEPIQKIATYTLEEFGFPIDKPENHKNIGLFVSTNLSDFDTTNNTKMSALYNGLNLYIDTSLSTAALTSDAYSTITESITNYGYLAILVPNDYNSIRLYFGTMKTDYNISSDISGEARVVKTLSSSLGSYKVLIAKGIEPYNISKIEFKK